MANRYCVMGQVFIVNGTGVITEAGRIAVNGANTLNVTTQGNFTFYMASGTTATVASGTAAVTGSPQTLSAGANTVTVTGTGTITLTLTIGTAANTNTVNSWSAASGGLCTASIPTAADNIYCEANSFTAGSQVLTVNADLYFLSMDWTGATNTPNLAHTGGVLYWNGTTCTFIAEMTITLGGKTFGVTGTAGGAGTQTLTTAGKSLYKLSKNNSSTLVLADALTLTNDFYYAYGTTNTNGQTVNCLAFNNYDTGTTATLGASTINCTSWTLNAGTTLSAGTSTIKVTGTGAFASGGKTYYNVELNGTAHTVSGAFTCNILTRNGTATKTDTVTFTSGTTMTCTTCAMIGNSATNRLLVQSSTLGTLAIIVATNWTGSANVDIMDISTLNVDLSAITGLSGDCGGNAGITFTTAVAQALSATGSWSDVTKWTTRVPLPQDNVTAGGAGITITVDMPRMGKSITFTGTPTVTLGDGFSLYGSLTLTNLMTVNTVTQRFRGRGNFTLTSAGKTIGSPVIQCPGGTLALLDNITASGIGYVASGTLDLNGFNVTCPSFETTGLLTRTLYLRSGVITLSGSTAITKWNFATITGLTFDAGTATIILTNSAANAQTFAGGGLTYNNVTVTGAGAYALTITGNNTFNNLIFDYSVASKTIVATGTTQIYTNIVPLYISTKTLTITAGTWTKAGGGVINLPYSNITNATANPAFTFYAPLSTDGGGNTRIYFYPRKKVSGMTFGKSLFGGTL